MFRPLVRGGCLFGPYFVLHYWVSFLALQSSELVAFLFLVTANFSAAVLLGAVG